VSPLILLLLSLPVPPALQVRDPSLSHLGILGPLMRAEVGDTLKVTLLNKLPPGSPGVSMHPHGVLYDKASEGAPYNDGTESEWVKADECENRTVRS
jgi:hypothetical protein